MPHPPVLHHQRIEDRYYNGYLVGKTPISFSISNWKYPKYNNILFPRKDFW